VSGIADAVDICDASGAMDDAEETDNGESVEALW
jgi:hypothetical protein